MKSKSVAATIAVIIAIGAIVAVLGIKLSGGGNSPAIDVNPNYYEEPQASVQNEYPLFTMPQTTDAPWFCVNEELKLKFFLAKGPDVPTYVEYGAADIGVVGKDTILEEGRNIYEVLDLGFGKCRMCICGPESARELLQHHEQIRVATKYPHIAKDYFYNKKHQTVEIIKLNGSIELAPIVGLSEVICDIVETGTTLKENGLAVLEEVCPLSARVVVNQVSMKMENERITKLIRDLKTVI